MSATHKRQKFSGGNYHSDDKKLLILKPPRIKKRVNVTIETIMEPDFERDDDESPVRVSSSAKHYPARKSVDHFVTADCL